jgi:hypothetical protein
MTNQNFPKAITITRQYANIISFLKKEYASYDKHDKHRLVTRRPIPMGLYTDEKFTKMWR